LTWIRHTFLITLLVLATAWQVLAQDATVKLSLAEFLKLNSQTTTTNQTDTSPIPYMFSQGDYRVTDEGEWARVEAAVSVRVYETGWIEIPLLPTNVLVESAKLDNKPLTLYPKDGNSTFLLKSPGNHNLTLSYYLKLDTIIATKSVTFQSPPTTVTNVRVVLKGEKLKVTSSPSIPLANAAASGKTVVKGTIPAGAGNVTLNWVPLQADPRLHGKTQQEKPKLYGRLYGLVLPAEHDVRSTVHVDYTILRNEVKVFKFKVPQGVEIDKVVSAHMEDWEVSKDRTLTVRLSEPVSGSHRVTLELERPLESTDSQWKVPLVQVEGLERIKASVAVASASGIEVDPVSQVESRPIDVRELPVELTSMHGAPLLLAYEYHKQPQEIVLKSRKGTELPVLEATIDQAQGSTLVTQDGKVCTAFSFELKNNHRQNLSLKLPAEAQVWSSFVDQQPVKPVKGEDGTIKLPLVTSDGTRPIPVRLVYVQEASSSGWLGSQSYTAPEVDLPISVLNWTVYLPADREVVDLGGTMTEGTITTQVMAQGEPTSTTEVDVVGGLASEADADTPMAQTQAVYKRKSGSGRLDNARMSQMLQETSRGAFPVEVQIPESGQAYQFCQLLVSAEPATVTVHYYSGPLILLLQIVVFTLVLGFGSRYSREPNGWRALTVLAGVSFLAAGLLPEGFLSRLLFWAVPASIILLGLWAYREHLRRQKERSREDVV
jgi:hypothetical protein